MAERSHDLLRRLFDLALAVQGEDRRKLLDQECAGNAELRARVEAMLTAAEDQHFLATPTSDFQPTIDVDSSRGPAAGGNGGRADTSADFAREAPGTRIGPYKLLQLIGEGGFGSVFMAEQEKPVVRKVALKIIKLGMDTRQVIARFDAERQALAMMDHPNIARVLDAGATETGRPYFVMDLVKGAPIAEYCDKNNLSIAERLDLFSQVCLAVQHAHTKGIIHRDIKPSNVLVSTVDGRPSVKVIDFGIAKATASKLTEKTLFTEHRQLIGTPEYMSPEQAEGSMDIDTRTDVYSLGVVLYELLTGSTPFSGKDLRSAAYAEIQRIIREVDPPAPSTRLSQCGETIASVAANRRTEPKKLGTLVRGELDWIVMKALEKDRSRRYESANDLGLDVQRYLRGEAIVAAPISRVYRMRKFVRRNRGPVVAGGLVAAALVLGVVGTTVGLIDATRQRRAADQARVAEVEQRHLAEVNANAAKQQAERAGTAERAAEGRLAEAEATVGFLDEMLGAVDPVAQGKDVSVRAVLDRAEKTMASKYADRPLVAARLHGTIGMTYMGLGVYDKGEPHVREQLRLREKELGADHPDTLRARVALGAFLYKAGKEAESEEVLKKAIADGERLLGRRHEITVTGIEDLAELYGSQMRLELAEPLLKEAVESRAISAGPESLEALGTKNSLATLYCDTHRFEESQKLFEQSLSTLERVYGKEHPLTLEVRGDLAWMFYWASQEERETHPELIQERLNKAQQLGEQTLEAKTRVLGEEHRSTLSTMGNLAVVYVSRNMLDKAEILKRKDLEISLRVLGEDHPDTIVSMTNLGAFLRQRKQYAEALPILERAVRCSRKVLAPENPGTAFALGWYSACLAGLGRFAEAEAPLLEARAMVGKIMGEDHQIPQEMSAQLADLYQAWEKADPGKGHAAQSREWRAKAAPKQDAAGAAEKAAAEDKAGAGDKAGTGK